MLGDDRDKAKELLRLALESGRLGLYQWRPQQGELIWDEGVRKIWGVGPDAPVSYDLFLQGVYPADRDRIQAIISKALDPNTSAGPLHAEYRVVGIEDAKERWVESTAHIEFESGRATRLIGVVQDITERKQAQIAVAKSEAYFRAIFETSGVGMSQADPQTGRLLRVNETLAAMLGYSPTELVGKRFSDFTHPLDREEDWERFRSMVRGETRVYESEKRYLTKSGEIVWGIVTASIVATPYGAPRTVAVIQDITARKRVEEELRKTATRKDEFLAMLSHELRNPLASIASSVHVLKEGDRLDATSKNRLWEIVERQVKHLNRLMDDLLDATRIATGKITLRKESVSLADVVDRAIDLSQPAIHARGHALRVNCCTETLVLEGDTTRLAQVVSNLLSNAAKYTPERGCISLDLFKEGTHAVIRVRDNGIGMSPHVVEHVFDLFSQARQAQAFDASGIGVGLSLARGLVEAHRGTIEAFSEGPGKGSEFVVKLPLKH